MKTEKEVCPLCVSSRIEYGFQMSGQRLNRCLDCESLFVIPVPDESPISNVMSGRPERSSESPYLDRPYAYLAARLQRYHTGMVRDVLVAGLYDTDFEEALSARDIKVSHASSDTFAQESFDACVLFEILGESAHPLAQLSLVRRWLRPGGTLMLTLPVLDSLRSDKEKGIWNKSKTARAVFFDLHNLTAFLVRCGFRDVVTWQEDDGIVLSCKKADCLPGEHMPRLSIVLPVYNERATCKELIDTVLAKFIPGIKREILIVESNSTDGSREIVKSFESHPEIRVIYEEQPRGKGYAVRTGLSHATGEILLIQDADLEYDVDDYDCVLEPLLTYRRLFVLGSRHNGGWKMREFEGRKWLSIVFNVGQIFFTWLINVTCGTRLKDPFTMYKVFHRECLYGLELESNRFDLDWEIVIKFIRKGFIPLEIPVNYVSRSFSEGKKIRPLRDPILWLWALVRFRYGPLYKSAMMMGRTR